MAQKIICTTSPWYDAQRNKWMLSCFFSIQLDAGRKTRLSEFPDILQWMDRIRNADFFVQWDKSLPLPVEPVQTRWDAELYKNLFSPSIEVKTFTPLDISKLLIKSYPVLNINNYILDTYQAVGNLKMTELPKAKFFRNEFKALSDISQVQVKTDKPRTDKPGEAKIDDFVTKGFPGRQAVLDQLARNKAIPFNPILNPKLDFGQFYNFHNKNEQKKAKNLSTPTRPEMEYHDILAVLTSYPVIMRKLALVLDFELRSAPANPRGTVRILPASLGFEDAFELSSPATAYLSTNRGFYAAARPGSPIDRGMLRINTPEFDVVQIDTEGTALKLAAQADTINMNFGKQLVRKSNYIAPIVDFKRIKFVPLTPGAGQPGATKSAPADDDDDDDDLDEGLPAIRSAGIGIIRNGLADQMIKKLTSSLQVYRSFVSPTAMLNAAALMNKIDIPQTPQTLVVPTNPAINRLAAQQRLPRLQTAFRQPELIPVPTETLYADDIVFGYRLDVAYEERPNEWFSLHKRKNKYAFVPAGGAEQPLTLAADEEIDEGCIHLSLTEDEQDDEDDRKINEVIARWEGWSLSVPRLGKGINNRGAEVSGDDDERKKHRLDPAAVFRLQVEVKPAPRSLPRLRFGKKYRIRIRTVDIAGNGLPHDVQGEDPARTVKSGIEYRRFDPLPSPVLWQADEIVGGDRKKIRDRDGESLQHLVIRSDTQRSTRDYERNNITSVTENGRRLGTLEYLHEAVRFVTAPRTSQQMAETHGMFDEAMRDPAKAKEIYAFINARDKEYVNDGKTKARLIPPDNGQLDIDYLADPMAAGVIFTMKTDTRHETPWKKDESRRFSFHFDEPVTDGNVDRPFTIDQWRSPRSLKIRLVEGSGAPSWEGRVFIIPLAKASVVEVEFASYWRPSDIDKISGLLPSVAKGSEADKVLQTAKRGRHWMFSPWRTLRLVHAVQQPMKAPQFNRLLLSAQRNFDDTQARIVSFIEVHGASTDRVDVDAEWTEMTDDLSKPAPSTVPYRTHVASIPVLYHDNLLELVQLNEEVKPTSQEILPPIRHALNDTRHRMIRYRPVATTRFREYFTGIIETAKLKGETLPMTAVGDAVELSVLSTARPPVPVVDYLVPSFSWSRADGRPLRTHLRTGNIRVYLKRPWYLSGDNERIAVILPPAGVDPSNDPILRHLCTQWGKDPVFDAGQLNGRNYPDANAFLQAETDVVRLSEAPDRPVSVAAYAVSYDAEKQLHYADIPMNTGQAYFPFVRLRLARYQKHSLRKNGQDCCLSGVVETDWMQIVPSRIVTLRETNQSNAFEVSVKGPAPFRSNNDGIVRNSARVRINISVDVAHIEKSEGLHVRINDSDTLKTTIFQRDFDLNVNDIRNGNIDLRETIRFDMRQAGRQLRVIVREYELHERDPLRPKQPGGRASDPSARSYDERLVFMDMFDL